MSMDNFKVISVHQKDNFKEKLKKKFKNYEDFNIPVQKKTHLQISVILMTMHFEKNYCHIDILSILIMKWPVIGKNFRKITLRN